MDAVWCFSKESEPLMYRSRETFILAWIDILAVVLFHFVVFVAAVGRPDVVIAIVAPVADL
jgi:hypothetical protein